MEYYSVLENGAHSMMKSREKLTQYYDNHEDERNIFLLKEATMFLGHGIEILLKELLYRLNPEKVFKKEELAIYKRKISVFKNPSEFQKITTISNLKTISLYDANESVRKYKVFEMKYSFYKQVKTLVKYRNKLFHFTFSSVNEALDYYQELWDTLIAAELYFEKSIAGYKKAIREAGYEHTTSLVISDRIEKLMNLGSEISSIEAHENEIDAYADMMDALERNHS